MLTVALQLGFLQLCLTSSFSVFFFSLSICVQALMAGNSEKHIGAERLNGLVIMGKDAKCAGYSGSERLN